MENRKLTTDELLRVFKTENNEKNNVNKVIKNINKKRINSIINDKKNGLTKNKKSKNWLKKISSFFKEIYNKFFKRKETPIPIPKPKIKKTSKLPSKERFLELVNYSENQEFIGFDSNSELLKNRKKINERYGKGLKLAPQMVNFKHIDEHNENRVNNSNSIKDIIDKNFYFAKRKLLSSGGIFNMNRYQANIHKRKNKLINKNIIENF